MADEKPTTDNTPETAPKKTTKPEPINEPVPTPTQPLETIPLAEFCRDLSTRDKRVELVNAFFKQSPVAVATQADFDIAFNLFANRKVGH